MEALYKMLLNLLKSEGNNAHVVKYCSGSCRAREVAGCRTLAEQFHTVVQNHPPGALSFAVHKQLHWLKDILENSQW